MTTPTTASSEKSGNTYDEVPYASLPFQQAHPDRMATIAKLFGMNPAPVDKCRILELGSAAGGHIIPLAANYPNSHVVGIDLSQVQIAEGQATVDALGLKNIELKAMSISDLPADSRKFDYIICHGVFSWIPESVQEDVLRICDQHLSPQGVAFISYNCFPGWHLRGMIRKMMQYHCEQFTDVATKVTQARALLDFLAQTTPESEPHGIMLRQELGFLSPQADSYIYHEFLEDLNKPMFFHEFADSAQKHNLQYVGEVEFHSMLANNLPNNAGQTVSALSNQIIHTEQYIDFVRNKFFRQSLLCKSDVQLNRALSPESILPFYVSAPTAVVTENFNATTNDIASFQLQNGMTVSSNSPLAKSALHHLGQIWPMATTVEELVQAAKGVTEKGEVTLKDAATVRSETMQIAADLLSIYSTYGVNLHTAKPPLVTHVSDKPKAPDLARHQSLTSNVFTNQLHQVISADVLGRNIIGLCDGNKGKDEILNGLVGLVMRGEVQIQKEGVPVKDEATAREILAPLVDQTLEGLARNAMLIS